MQDVLKEKGGKGNHFEIPPADFLSDVDCAKKRRLALFDTPASKKCHQEKEIVSCLEYRGGEYQTSERKVQRRQHL